MKKRYLILITAAVLFLGLILEIWVMNRLSTFGEQIVKLERSAAELKLENKILENQIAEKSSLRAVKEYSRVLAFTNIKNITYIKPSEVAFSR